MDSTERAAGEVIRLGLLSGLSTVAEAVAWADAVITAESTPHPSVLEVALAGRQAPKEVAALLSAVPGPIDRGATTRRFLARLLHALRADATRLRQVIMQLYHLRTEGELPEAAYGPEPWMFEDELDLAERKIFGSVDDVRHHVEEYLEQYSREAEA